MLYIIGTPIGNLKDISLRAIETLQSVDSVICEDTRRTSILMNHYQIKKPMYVLNDFNENKNLEGILDRLRSGLNIALVSDAGMPLISDPGYKLVRETINQNIEVDIIPGPTAAITALLLSGMPPDKFFFVGYLPEKSGARITMLSNLQKINQLIKTTFIVYSAPHKLMKTLEDILNTLGDIEIVCAAELTKINQKVTKDKVSNFINKYQKGSIKGEFTILLTLS